MNKVTQATFNALTTFALIKTAQAIWTQVCKFHSRYHSK